MRGILTEMHRVQCGNLTAQALHDQGCHRVANVATACQSSPKLPSQLNEASFAVCDSPIGNLGSESAASHITHATAFMGLHD